MAARLQLEQGCLLSHFTFLFLQVTHDLRFSPAVPLPPFVVGVDPVPLLVVGSLGEALLFWLPEAFRGIGDVLVRAGDAEKFPSC